MYRAMHSFRPQEDLDVELRVGDIITNLEYIDLGWALGFNVNTRKAGTFPRRFVHYIQETPSSIFAPIVPKNRPFLHPATIDEYVNSEEIADGVAQIDHELLKVAIQNILYSKRGQHPILKGVVGFFAGVVLGVLTYIGCAFALEYPPLVAAGIAIIAGLLLTIGLVLSTRCRALVALCIPTLSTKSGRFMFSTFAAALLLSGPLGNIARNSAELSAVSGCAGQLLANQTSFIQQLASEPYRVLVDGLKQTVRELKQSMSTINNLLTPFNNALIQIEKTRATINSELTKIKNECQNKLTATENNCRQKVLDVSNQCRKFVTDAKNSWNCGFLGGQSCAERDAQADRAMSECRLLNNELCTPVSSVKSTCDGLQIAVDVTNFAEAIEQMEKALSTDVKFTDTVEGGAKTNTSIQQIPKTVKAQIMYYVGIVMNVSFYVQIVLSLSVLRVVYEAFMYIRKYLKDDRFDNTYITKEFIVVDERRRKKGKYGLLPLTPKERKLVTDKRKCFLSSLERKNFCRGMISVLVNIIGGLAFIAFDHLLYWAILLSNKYGNVEIEFRENVDLGVQVEDGGLLSAYLQKLIGNLRTRNSFNHTIDFSVCLPEGTAPAIGPIIGLAVINLVLLVIVFLQAYMLRIRHTIAGYFYPERSRQRIKQFYRVLLRQRVLTVKEIKDVVKLKREQAEAHEVAKDLFDDLNSMMGCYDTKHKCYVCGKRDEGDKMIQCDFCYSHYCQNCFMDILQDLCPCDPSARLAYDYVSESDFEENVSEDIAVFYSSNSDQDQVLDRRMMNRQSRLDYSYTDE